MIAFARNIRLIPVVLAAVIGLFALKTLGLLVEGGYTLGGATTARNEAALKALPAGEIDPSAAPEVRGLPSATPGRTPSWAQSMFNYPDITGSVGGGEAKPAAGTAEPIPLKVTDKPPPAAAGINAPLDTNRPMSPGERAILERLGERRQELDSRARELEMRENLLKATEKRLDAKVNELKDVENRITGAMHKRDADEQARFKTLVTMYENMKAKDAARIFDRLDIKILIDVASQINPRRMSDILAQMTPEAAERLTVELANRASGDAGRDLPKIEGKPTN